MKTILDSTRLRPVVKGKFIDINNEHYIIKGVTYGTFEPDNGGSQFPSSDKVEFDFGMMVSYGINTIRTYTVPSRQVLDTALKYGIRVMIGLPWQQHITFLDNDREAGQIVKNVRKSVQECAAHPAILCFTIGNEIPAPIVRWYGEHKIRNFLKRIYLEVKKADPDALVTYVNYPTTEYLDLPFLDFHCFNVYLETPQKLSAYLSRLHNIIGDKPLVLAEIGLDSHRNGTIQQAEILDWQIRAVFEKGCAGIFIFSWTDEWWRGGLPIEDWDFGLVDRQRKPKPALEAVQKVFQHAPFAPGKNWPKISVVVCSYNGATTIRDTLEACIKLEYPDYEVIVINDGSTDKTGEMAEAYPVKVIHTANGGLSNARNRGIAEASGEIIAFTDDDAFPDPLWLRYLAMAYLESDMAGIGGPNIAPDGDGLFAESVANAPGRPVHVLITDEIAEHIPGCNMSFRKDVLLKAGCFNPVYTSAGDDVDICWKIQQLGYDIGFHPAAFVWHHCRNGLKIYWKQQKGYGKAEALLEKEWPDRYNSFGHLTWGGYIYGTGNTKPIQTGKKKIFYGSQGTALFQSVYQPAFTTLKAYPLMPEWYMLIFFLGTISLLGLEWHPLLIMIPLFFCSYTGSDNPGRNFSKLCPV